MSIYQFKKKTSVTIGTYPLWHNPYEVYDISLTVKRIKPYNNYRVKILLGKKPREFLFLDNNGDQWRTDELTLKLFGGDCLSIPNGLAIDTQTLEIYFVHAIGKDFSLQRFALFPEKHWQKFLKSFNQKRPYRIQVCAFALMKFIEGEEGWNHLRNNLELELKFYGSEYAPHFTEEKRIINPEYDTCEVSMRDTRGSIKIE